MHFEWEFSPFRIQTLTWSHPCRDICTHRQTHLNLLYTGVTKYMQRHTHTDTLMDCTQRVRVCACTDTHRLTGHRAKCVHRHKHTYRWIDSLMYIVSGLL